MRYKGRIYEALEWGTWLPDNGFCHAAMVMSCDQNAVLLKPENWSFTEPRKFDHFTPNMAELPTNGANSFHDSNYSTFHTIKDFRNI